ncbi:MAG: hypothetical protein JNM80_01440 [Phycisphaerae bacterium]|nr:hypothetical protein [Phycisphaerae bacterium]
MRTKTWGAISTTALLSICGLAQGQSYSFEPATYTGSAAGTLLTGQDAWYLPAVANSGDGFVYTYAGNTYGVVANPSGGSQFVGGECSTTLQTFVRMQHDIAFTEGTWTMSADFNGLFSTVNGGVLPAADNIGSWSMQPSATARYFQFLMNWGSGAVAGILQCPGCPPLTNYAPTGDKYHILVGYFTAASPATISFEPPTQDWMDLSTNNWYRITAKWNFTTAQLLEVSIRNLTAGGSAVVTDLSSRGMYLFGGPSSVNPLPTAMRLFTGSLAFGNVTAWDNVSVGPMAMGPSCYANCDNSTILPFLNVNDFVCFNNKFAAGDTNANCDQSTIPPVLNVNDFICFNNAFAAGCSAP